ncbi:MAG: sialidase family protein [Acidobacteriota bacterium]
MPSFRLLSWPLLVFLLLPAPAPRAQCCLPRVVVENRFEAEGDKPIPWLGADRRGGLYLFVSRATALTLMASRDDGVTWTPLALPTPGIGATDGAAAVDPDGTLLVVVQDSTGLNVLVYPNGAEEPRAPVPISSSGFGPRVVVGPDRRAAIVWPSGSAGIGVSLSTDSGSTWTSPTLLSAGGSQHHSPDALFVDDHLLITWSERDADNQDSLRGSHSDDDGQTFSAPVVLNTSAQGGAPAALASTADGHVQLALTDYDLVAGESTFGLRTSLDAGTSWLSGTMQSETVPLPRSSGWVTLTANDAGHVQASWSRNGELLVSHSTEHGLPGTWSAATLFPVFAHAIRTYHHQVLDASGTVDLVWADERNDFFFDLHLGRSCNQGQSWSSLRLDDDEDPTLGRSGAPMAVRSASGRLHVTWRDAGRGYPRNVWHLGLDEDPQRPAIRRVDSPATGCGEGRRVLEAVPESIAWCPFGRIVWYRDGVEVHSGLELDISDEPPELHRYEIEAMDCFDFPATCGRRSVESWHLGGTAATPGDVSNTVIEGLLFVTRQVERLHLTWSDAAELPTGHHVYAGTIDSLNRAGRHDHDRLLCAVERSVVDPESGTAELELPEGDRYFLIAPADCITEGELGSDSLGRPRPPGSSSCGAMP